MKLLLVSDEGSVVDATDDFTREEFDRARSMPLGAVSMLQELNADAS